MIKDSVKVKKKHGVKNYHLKNMNANNLTAFHNSFSTYNYSKNFGFEALNVCYNIMHTQRHTYILDL